MVIVSRILGLLLVAQVSGSMASKAEEVSLLLHCVPASYDGCGSVAVDSLSCDAVNVFPAGTGPWFVHVLVDGLTIAARGAQFGIQYEDAVVEGWTLCTGGMQIPSEGWPRSGEALTVTWPESAGVPAGPLQLVSLGYFTVSRFGPNAVFALTADQRTGAALVLDELLVAHVAETGTVGPNPDLASAPCVADTPDPLQLFRYPSVSALVVDATVSATEVEDYEPVQGPSHRRTIVSFVVDSVLVGDAQPGPLVAATPGGCIGRDCMFTTTFYPGGVSLSKGQRVIASLQTYQPMYADTLVWKLLEHLEVGEGSVARLLEERLRHAGAHPHRRGAGRSFYSYTSPPSIEGCWRSASDIVECRVKSMDYLGPPSGGYRVTLAVDGIIRGEIDTEEVRVRVDISRGESFFPSVYEGARAIAFLRRRGDAYHFVGGRKALDYRLPCGRYTFAEAAGTDLERLERLPRTMVTLE